MTCLPCSSRDARVRYAHFLHFGNTGELANHLDADDRPKTKDRGYSCEETIQGILSWHRRRLMVEAREREHGIKPAGPTREELNRKAAENLLLGAHDPDDCDELCRVAGFSERFSDGVRAASDLWRAATKQPTRHKLKLTALIADVK